MSDLMPPLDTLLPSPPPPGVDPVTHTTEITARSGTSFAAGMAILPRPRRNAMRALYAFCRVVDDIADGDYPPAEKDRALAAWEQEIDALYRGIPTSSVGLALLGPVRDYGLPKQEFLLMIEGMAMDAHGPVVAPSRKVYEAYTRRVAGTVGVLSMRIFGAWRGEVSDRFALALADALQVTNILRDVEEDAEIGRLYLPREVLSEHGIETSDPMAVARHPRLPEVRRYLGREARAHYDRARELAPAHDRKSLRPALMMMGAYEGYLDAMEARAFHDVDTLSLSKRRKVLRGLKYAVVGPGLPPAAHARLRDPEPALRR